jgi:hypothetical protein
MTSIADLVRTVEELLPVATERLAGAMPAALTGDAADDYDDVGYRVGDALIPADAIEPLPELDRACYELIRLLSRDPAARREIATALDLPDTIEEIQPGVGWLRILLTVLDDEPLLVFHVPARRGFRTRISGISSNFQLHTLLADALIGRSRGRLAFLRPKNALGGPAPHPDVVAVCDGSGPQTIDRPSDGVWNMYQWRAIAPDATLPEHVDSKFWVWGEGIPADIEYFEDTRVLLLGPPAYARQWNTGREFAALRASVEIEATLSQEETEKWLHRFAKAR